MTERRRSRPHLLVRSATSQPDEQQQRQPQPPRKSNAAGAREQATSTYHARHRFSSLIVQRPRASISVVGSRGCGPQYKTTRKQPSCSRYRSLRLFRRGAARLLPAAQTTQPRAIEDSHFAAFGPCSLPTRAFLTTALSRSEAQPLAADDIPDRVRCLEGRTKGEHRRERAKVFISVN